MYNSLCLHSETQEAVKNTEHQPQEENKYNSKTTSPKGQKYESERINKTRDRNNTWEARKTIPRNSRALRDNQHTTTTPKGTKPEQLLGKAEGVITRGVLFTQSMFGIYEIGNNNKKKRENEEEKMKNNHSNPKRSNDNKDHDSFRSCSQSNS